MCWGQCERVFLFVNSYGVTAWLLRGSDQPYEQEGVLGKWEMGESRKWVILEDLAPPLVLI